MRKIGQIYACIPHMKVIPNIQPLCAVFLTFFAGKILTKNKHLPEFHNIWHGIERNGK
jgi:hypothetical protein